MRSLYLVAVIAAGLMALGAANSFDANAALSDYPDWAQEAFCPRSGGVCP